MFLTDEPMLVLLLGICLAAVSAVVLFWRAASRKNEAFDVPPLRVAERQPRPAPALRPVATPAQHATAAPTPSAAAPAAARSAASTTAGPSYTEIAVAAAEARARANAATASQRAASTEPLVRLDGDDPFGVVASLPPGASYTAIAVATAEAALRAKAGAGTSART